MRAIAVCESCAAEVPGDLVLREANPICPHCKGPVWAGRVSALSALRELVVCKDLKDEELRLRQRRDVAIQRKPDAVARADAMRDEYNRRKPIAWANARAVIAKSKT